MNQANFPRRKEEKRKAAEARQESRAQRPDSEQLKKLEAAGHGHCKEARRLRGEVL